MAANFKNRIFHATNEKLFHRVQGLPFFLSYKSPFRVIEFIQTNVELKKELEEFDIYIFFLFFSYNSHLIYSIDMLKFLNIFTLRNFQMII